MTDTIESTTTTRDDKGLGQAKCQFDSIREMVRAMDRETASEDYADTLDRAECIKILCDNDNGLGEQAIEHADKVTLEELREAIAEGLNDETIDDDGFEFDEDSARERINEDALSVEVRSDWHIPGDGNNTPGEFNILLCTGGPAARIIGDLDEHCEPTGARLQYQDWGTPWTELYLTGDDVETLLTYARQFYFSEE